MPEKYWIGTDGSWTTAGNWSPSGVPVDGDTVWITELGSDIDPVDQSSVLLAALHIHQSFIGSVGDATGYVQVGATTCCIGYQPSTATYSGSGRIKLDLGTDQTDLRVYNTSASALESGKPPVRILGIHSSNVAHVYGGKVGFAASDVSEVSTFGTITLAGQSSELWGGTLTATALRVNAGTANLRKTPSGSIFCDGGAIYINDPAANSLSSCLIKGNGRVYTYGSFGVTSYSVYGGTLTSNSTGTIGFLGAFGGSTEFRTSDASRTVTDCVLNAGAILNVDTSIVTFTNPIQSGLLTEIGCS